MLFRDWQALMVTFACFWGSATFGFDTGIGGGVIALSSFQRAFYGSALGIVAKANLSSNIVSILFLGAFIAAILSGFTSKYLGRKPSLQIASLVFLLGSFLQIGQTSNINYLYGGRVVSGLGIGYVSALCPIYIAETAPNRLRGAFTSCFQLGIVTGGMLAYWITYGCSVAYANTDNFQWRFPLAFQALPSGLLFVTLFFCPESPRWLAARGKDEAALQSLARLRGLPTEDAEVQAEIAAILTQVREEQAWGFQGSWKQKTSILLAKGNWQRITLSWYIATALIWCGSNAVLYYAPSIFASVGVTGISQSLLASGILTVVKFVCTIIFVVFGVERFKRRTILIVGSFFMAFFMLLLGGLLNKYPVTVRTRPDSLKGGFEAIIYLYVVSYSVSVAAINWVVMAEVHNGTTKQFGMASAVALTWLLNYAISKSTPLAIVAMGYGWWLFIGVLNLLFGIGYFFIPETKGVTVEEMDVLFGSVRREEREQHLANFGKVMTHEDHVDIKEKDLGNET